MEPTWMPWRGRRIHIGRARNPSASARLIVVHGGGGYSGALWPLAQLAAAEGLEVLAPDMPLYGDTEEPAPGAVRYDDWIDLLCDIVTTERRRDNRPIVLLGASMGGMVAYEAAARTRDVAALLATCLLDLSDPAALAAASRWKVHGGALALAVRLAGAAAGSVRVPIRWIADMSAMSSNPALAKLCAADPKGGGVKVPLGFLSSWLRYRHTAPENYRGAPVTLVHPAADAWTPPERSSVFLQRISAPTRTVLLDNCGHYPIEEPGLTQLEDVLRETVTAVVEHTDRR